MARGVGHSSVIKRVFSELDLRSARWSSIGSARQSSIRSGDGGSPTGSGRNLHAEKGGRGVSRIELGRSKHFRGFQFSVLRKVLFGWRRSQSSMMQPNRYAGDSTRSAPVSRNESLVKGVDSADMNIEATTPSSRTRSSFPDEEEMKSVFEGLDENHDGSISSEELRQYVEHLGLNMSPEEVESLLKTVDENGDGRVTFDEFYSLYPRPRTESEQSQSDEAKEEDLKSAFRVYDKDGDGYIDAMELRSVLMSLKIKEGSSLKKCEQMIKRVDVDGNGKVDFQEFKKMMSSDAF